MSPILAVVFATVTSIIGASAAEPAYRFEKLGTVPWGIGDSDVGYEQGFDRNVGPISFAVLGDSIYFIDNVQRKVKIFSATNGAVSVRIPSFPSPYPLDIAVRQDGTVFLLDIDNNIYEYGPSDAAPRAVAPVSKRLRNIKGLLLVGDTLFVTTFSQFSYPIRSSAGFISPTEQELAFAEGIPSSTPGYFTTSVEDQHDGFIRRRNRAGVVESEWPFRAPGPPLLTLIFEAALSETRTVVTAEFGSQGGNSDVSREILICDFGEPVFKVPLPFIYYTYQNRDLAITAEGDMYHMLSDEDGITFIRLRPDASGHRGRLDYPAAYSRRVHFNDRVRRGARELREDSPRDDERR